MTEQSEKKTVQFRLFVIIFGIVALIGGVLLRMEEIQTNQVLSKISTENFEPKPLPDKVSIALNFAKIKWPNLRLPVVHPPSGNLVNPDTEEIVGSQRFHEPMYYFHFGENTIKKGEKKGETKPAQEVAFSASFGAKVYLMWEKFRNEYGGCELYLIDGYRDAKTQFAKWAGTGGRAASRPLVGDEGGHGIGRAVDIHRACNNLDHRIPLGKLSDGTIVWYGHEPKRGRGVKGIKPDKETKEDVIRWIKEVRFTNELAELSKLPDYNEEKCVEYAYLHILRGLIASNLEGAHMALFEFAKEQGLTGAACTKAMPLDAGHYSEVESVFFGEEEKISEKQKAKAERIEIYRQCNRGSEKWNDYYYKSMVKANKSLKNKPFKNTTPALILFPTKKCTD